MNQATEVYSREFDTIFFKLPPHIHERIESRIRELGTKLQQFSHVRLQGRREFRLRVGDYRVIYEFDPARNELFLITLGHRREVYR